MGWEDPKVIVAVAAAAISLVSMGVSIYSAKRAFLASATQANFGLISQALTMIDDESGPQLLRFLGISEADLREEGLSRTDFVFVAKLLLGSASWYDLGDTSEPGQVSFAEHTFPYHLCRQPHVRKVWKILGPMWGIQNRFVQMMDQTIREQDARRSESH